MSIQFGLHSALHIKKPQEQISTQPLSIVSHYVLKSVLYCWHVKTRRLKLHPLGSPHSYSTHQQTSPLPCLRMQPFEPSRTVALSRMRQNLLAHPESAESISRKKRSHPFQWYSTTTNWVGCARLWGCRVPLKEPHVCVEQYIYNYIM